MISEIPKLETENLILRPMRAGDWEAYGAFMASDRSRYMGGPFTPEGAWGVFCADHAQWSFFGVGSLMIEDRAKGETLGNVGINSGPLVPEWELGWMVYPGAEGRGIAFEAASALRDWARDQRQLETLVSYIDPENVRSARLAERLGAVLDPEAPRSDPADLVYRHFRRT